MAIDAFSAIIDDLKDGISDDEHASSATDSREIDKIVTVDPEITTSNHSPTEHRTLKIGATNDFSSGSGSSSTITTNNSISISNSSNSNNKNRNNRRPNAPESIKINQRHNTKKARLLDDGERETPALQDQSSLQHRNEKLSTSTRDTTFSTEEQRNEQTRQVQKEHSRHETPEQKEDSRENGSQYDHDSDRNNNRANGANSNSSDDNSSSSSNNRNNNNSNSIDGDDDHSHEEPDDGETGNRNREFGMSGGTTDEKDDSHVIEIALETQDEDASDEEIEDGDIELTASSRPTHRNANRMDRSSLIMSAVARTILGAMANDAATVPRANGGQKRNRKKESDAGGVKRKRSEKASNSRKKTNKQTKDSASSAKNRRKVKFKDDDSTTTRVTRNSRSKRTRTNEPTNDNNNDGGGDGDNADDVNGGVNENNANKANGSNGNDDDKRGDGEADGDDKAKDSDNKNRTRKRSASKPDVPSEEPPAKKTEAKKGGGRAKKIPTNPTSNQIADYAAQLEAIPDDEWAVFDNAYVSLYGPEYRNSDTYGDGIFHSEWVKVLVAEAAKRGVNILGTLPHHRSKDGDGKFAVRSDVVELSVSQWASADAAAKKAIRRVYVGVDAGGHKATAFTFSV